ncbi:hypothetical protein TNCV_1868191 [Trichonephila clavipes]|nr:hypothetical protein TNCV_1868191 [Trichonephila clavipes]
MTLNHIGMQGRKYHSYGHISCHPLFNSSYSVTEPQQPIPMSNAIFSNTNDMFSAIESSSIISAFLSSSNSGIEPPSASTTVRDLKQNAKTHA